MKKAIKIGGNPQIEVTFGKGMIGVELCGCVKTHNPVILLTPLKKGLKNGDNFTETDKGDGATVAIEITSVKSADILIAALEAAKCSLITNFMNQQVEKPPQNSTNSSTNNQTLTTWNGGELNDHLLSFFCQNIRKVAK